MTDLLKAKVAGMEQMDAQVQLILATGAEMKVRMENHLGVGRPLFPTLRPLINVCRARYTTHALLVMFTHRHGLK